ncbi:hypothetical protein JKP88DRAFT_273450 [Tribonema minus]|uniref:Uncharacterized protein n=1 Tax=Tribonema minus TaxID=303371 RepID=A0A836CD76_9STRA|nr:hypothetical protein JKP88DRAFT_273450 [Tribonema minus]
MRKAIYFEVGDAAHSMSASIGQGVNAALESVSVLAEELGCAGKGGDAPCAPVQAEDVPAAVTRYSARRLPDAVGICAMSHRGSGRTPLQRAVFVAQRAVFVAQRDRLGRADAEMMCTAALGKLGLSAPPALALVGRPDISYASIYATELRQRAAAAALIVATLAAAAATAALRSAVPPLALAAALCALSAAARLRRATRGGARAHSA